MSYEINVSLNGEHLFATHERSLHYTHQLELVYRIMLDKFPESEGYKVTVFEQIKYSKDLTSEQLDKLKDGCTPV